MLLGIVNNASLIETINVLGRFFSVDIAGEWNSYCRSQEQFHPLHVQKEQIRMNIAYKKWMKQTVLHTYHTIRQIPYVVFNHIHIPAHGTKLVTRPGSKSQTFSLGEKIRLEVTFPKDVFRIRVPFVTKEKMSWGYDQRNQCANTLSIFSLAGTRMLLDQCFPTVLVMIIFDFTMEERDLNLAATAKINLHPRRTNRERSSGGAS